MREIRFRAKNPQGKWISGFYVHDGINKQNVIVKDYLKNIEAIDINTLGMSTGLEIQDIEIFEGDIIKFNNYIGIISFGKYQPHWGKGNNLGFYVKWVNDKYDYLRQDILFWIKDRDINTMVIGNIHDNHELIKDFKL